MNFMPPKNRAEELRERFTTGFLWFWVKQFRISYLIVITIIIMGMMAAVNIPKESSPSVKLGIVSISTAYPGTNPIDMDSLVTDKIYKEVKDIKWIDKINSSSSLGFSNISLTLKTDADVKDVLSDVRSAVGRVTLPSDAKTPSITEIETDTNRAFSIYIYAKNPETTKALLFDRAIELKKVLEWVSGINTVDLSAGGEWKAIEAWGWNDGAYEVHIIIPEEKLANLWLTLGGIAQSIQSYNRDQPIGNFSIGEKKYDFRIEGKNKESFDFLKVPLSLPSGWSITLGDIATIERKYKNDAYNRIILGWALVTDGSVVSGEGPVYPYVWLTVNKTDSASIFRASDAAKEKVGEIFQKPEYKNFAYTYAIDLADNIRDDYDELAKEAVTTLVLVFIAMYLFVGFRDSLFASITLPLAFLSTFLLLYYGGYTMNFLTNFSLILSFGIAVDTIIVIVQAASAKIRVGYDPQSAIMLALREYAVPIISWVMTTIVVFIPMMTLPGILGKFLAYIPITIFGVLATGLILALTVNSALYLLFVKRAKNYVDDPHAIEYASDEEKELLTLEREWKTRIGDGHIPLRIRVIHSVTEWYKSVLRNFLEHTVLRRLAIIVPFLFFIFGFVVLAPRVGFNLFPSDDNAFTSFIITGPVGQRTEVTKKELDGIAEIFLSYPEIKYSNLSIHWNTANISVQLTKRQERKKLWQRDIFTLEKILLSELQVFESKGYRVVSEVLKNGPPGSKAVWLKLIVDDPDKLSTLINVSKEFEAHLKTIPGTKNVSRSSNDTPGQFIFKLKKDLIATTGITPAMIYGQIAQNMNGVTLGTVEDNGEDMDIILKSSQFVSNVRLEDVLAIPLVVGQTSYVVWDFVESKLTNATASVTRENGNIQITVDADLKNTTEEDKLALKEYLKEVKKKKVDESFESLKKSLTRENLKAYISSLFTTPTIQSEFTEYAKKYQFPPGVSYQTWGENEANSELITAVLSAFFIAIIVIFAILTLQFHSFSQPAVILYSVIMSLPFVMIGLLLTGNQFSLPFGIWFIAFTGIAVNHGIILIAAINENLKKGIEGITALVEAGSSRLEPMLLTTVTTALGILPIALRDKFWSGMGFTIIFGVMAASALTLFVVKGIYYEFYLNPEDGMIKSWYKKSKELIKRAIAKKRTIK